MTGAASTDACAEPRRPGRPRDPQADEQIVAAAIEVLTEQGFSGFTVEAVAVRAGVGKATIYRRWATREDLVHHVAAGFVQKGESVDTGSVRTDLVEWFWGRFKKKSVAQSNQLVGHVLVEASVNPEMRQLMRTWSEARREALSEILERGVTRGELPPSVDVESVIDLLSGAVLYRSMFADTSLTKEKVERLVDVVLVGLAD